MRQICIVLPPFAPLSFDMDITVHGSFGSNWKSTTSSLGWPAWQKSTPLELARLGYVAGAGASTDGEAAPCCWKADGYLNSFAAPAVDTQQSLARELTAGGAPDGANAWHEGWIRLLAKSLGEAGAPADLPAPAVIAESSDLASLRCRRLFLRRVSRCRLV